MAQETDDEGWELLSSYSRKQAIEDGVLVDVSAIAADLVQNAGVKLHVAMTNTVWGEYVEVPEGVVGQDWKGRLWDILWLFRCAAKAVKDNTICFSVRVSNDDKAPREARLKAVCGPDDEGKPCLTIMAAEED